MSNPAGDKLTLVRLAARADAVLREDATGGNDFLRATPALLAALRGLAAEWEEQRCGCVPLCDRVCNARHETARGMADELRTLIASTDLSGDSQ